MVIGFGVMKEENLFQKLAQLYYIHKKGRFRFIPFGLKKGFGF